MPIEKSTVINRIKAKHPNTNLSQTRMDAIADRLINKLADDADETAIDSVIDDFNHYSPFTEIAKNDDRIRDLEVKAKKNDPKPGPKPEGNKEQFPEGTPDWFKKWTQSNDAKQQEIANKLEGFEKSKSKETLTARFTSDERVKDIDPIFLRGFMPASEDDYETNITSLLADYTKYNETHKVEKIGGDKPTGSQGGEGKPKEASKEEVDAVMGKIQI